MEHEFEQLDDGVAAVASEAEPEEEVDEDDEEVGYSGASDSSSLKSGSPSALRDRKRSRSVRQVVCPARPCGANGVELSQAKKCMCVCALL